MYFLFFQVELKIGNDCITPFIFWESFCGVVVNEQVCDIVVNKFKVLPCYYVLFETNTLQKGMNPLIPKL